MPSLPRADQFPDFSYVVSLLETESSQCIWYLPDKARLCLVPSALPEKLPKEKAVLKLASITCGKDISPESLIADLAKIAQWCCCPRHHYYKLEGTGLARQLATRWLAKLLATAKLEPRSQVVHIKSETRSEMVHVESETKAVQSDLDIFDRRQLVPWESLVSKLTLDIDARASKNGSLYCYTHTLKSFSGMVKIGYGRSIQTRLDAWAECGHGQPKLLASFESVRHPERVESLVHFELANHWHILKWCKIHQQSHVEWFKIDIGRVNAVAGLWCRWMREANPYDRRGQLKENWKSHIDFLIQHDNPVTAQAMVQIHELEMGSSIIREFIDDEILRQKREVMVKKEVKDEDE